MQLSNLKIIHWTISLFLIILERTYMKICGHIWYSYLLLVSHQIHIRVKKHVDTSSSIKKNEILFNVPMLRYGFSNNLF